MGAVTRPALTLSSRDVDRIEMLLEDPALAAGTGVAALRAEIERANVVEPNEIPADVVTMNSVARCRNDATGEDMALTLVYPRDADVSSGKVSVLAPVGTALLGLKVGESIDWRVPSGALLRLRVVGIDYQPEAAGDLHR